MTPHHRDALIGLTAVVAALALAALLLLFGAWQFGSTWVLTVQAPATGGVGEGSIVRLNGVPVGTVTTVESIREGPWQVRMTAAIDLDVVIPDTAAALVAAGPLGKAADLYLESTPGATGVLPVDGSAVLEGPLPSMAMRAMTRELDARLQPVLASIDALTTPWIALGTGLQAFIEDPEVTGSAKNLLHLAVASLDRTVEAMERFSELAVHLDREADALSEEALRAARQLTEALDQTTQLVQSIREGKGTLGQLVVNPDVYNSLSSTAKELDRLSRSLRLLIDQVREEGAGSLIAP